MVQPTGVEYVFNVRDFNKFYTKDAFTIINIIGRSVVCPQTPSKSQN